MALQIGREEVLRRQRDGARLVEALPGDEFRALHIPGALNIPLGDFTEERVRRQFSPGEVVVTYCQDQL